MPKPAGICDCRIDVHADVDQLAETCADRLVTLSNTAIANRGLFHLALSGGSTPGRLYRALADPARQQYLDWTRIHLYFGDERAVPVDHSDSNFRMVRESLLDHAAIPAANIHCMHADPEHIERDARAYAACLLDRLPTHTDGMPIFDLVLLGLGPDGHTCSLFPDTPILAERERPVAPVYVERLQSWRLSLTYPVLNAARHLLFLVAGSDKAAIMQKICTQAPDDNAALPVLRIRPQGQVEWHIDKAAAAGLTP